MTFGWNAFCSLDFFGPVLCIFLLSFLATMMLFLPPLHPEYDVLFILCVQPLTELFVDNES